jgi:universal stress protein E
MINIDSILVVIEPNQVQQPALERGIALAQKTQAKLMVMLSVYHAGYELKHMLSKSEREDFRAEYIADRYNWLEDILLDYALPAQTLTAIHWHPHVYESVIETACAENINLIIKSMKYDPVVISPVFTPLDWHLIRKSVYPVLLVSESNVHYENIVTAVNTGFEDRNHHHLNEKLTECADEIADIFHSKVHLVNAYPPSPEPISKSSPQFSYNMLSQAIKNHHHQAMDMFGERFSIAAQHRHVIEGEPHVVLPSIIKSVGAQLLIIGSVGKAGIAAKSIGQSAEFIIDNVKCDVLAIKPDGFVPPLH